MDLKIKDNSKLKLASFTRLEYIESTGTQYINTGFQPKVNDEFEITYMITGTTGTFNSIFGTRVTPTSNAFVFGYMTGSSYIELGNQNISGLNKGYSQNIKHIIKLESGNLYIDNVLDRSIIINQNTVHNLLLFALNHNGTPSEFGKCRIYNFTIKRENVKVLDLIPVNKDNILCMYDTVSGQFFTNAGTGDFVAGPKVPGLPNNILLKTTTLYHKNTPNVGGLQLLNDILNAQETAEDVALERIRVDIGNVSGSIFELMHYSSMAGFNDAGEEQAKPRLVGTWTVNDWYTQEQLAQAQTAFDGLTIVGDSNYLINFDDLAVQVVDPNQDNYNPAVAIILQGKNLGTTIATAPLGHGRWFMTKTQAAAITRLDIWSSGSWHGMFTSITTVSDSNNIIDGNSYEFASFNELEQFIGLTTLGNTPFMNCSLLESIILPHQITFLPDYTFRNCTKLIDVNLMNIVYYGNSSLRGCKIKLSNVDNVTYIGSGTFNSCINVSFTEIPANITNIPENNNNTGTFANTIGIPYLHFLSETPVTGLFASYARTHIYSPFYGTTYKIYVGDGSSELHDQEILAAYKFNSNWSGMVSYLDSWYDFAIPHLSYDGEHVTITVYRESTIYYTTDGTTPTTESMVYTEPFSWDGHGVIKTMATNSYNDTVYAKDFYSTTVDNPEITINTTTKQITLSSITSGSTIYYTLDGSYPTLDSSIYSGHINATELGDIVKVRCFAVKDGMNDSEVVGRICVMDDTLWGTDGDTSSFAVQCIDSTKPNYNPAVCIILDNNNKLSDKLIGGGGYISKDDAAKITDIGTWFQAKTTITDTLGIIDNVQTYDFESFAELKFFTNVTNFAQNAFRDCSKLIHFNFPPNISSIGKQVMYGCFLVEFNKIPDTVISIGDRAFENCRKITISSVPSTFTNIATWFPDCYSISQFDFTNITSTGYQSFYNCTGLLEVNLPDTFTVIGKNSFAGCTSITFFRIPPLITNIPDVSIQTSTDGIIHCTPETPPTIAQFNTFKGAKKIYVGDGSSSSHDDAILAAYQSNSSWNTYYGSKIDTWYNYLHPTT